MRAAHRQLRIPRGSALPLRLRELLWLDPAPTALDPTNTGIYHSAMNQVVRESSVQAVESPSEGGATLFTFLEVADQLYQRISEALGRVGLSYAKYEVLEHLRAADEPVSLSALAEGQSCARSNITQIVDRLESEGLVRQIG